MEGQGGAMNRHSPHESLPFHLVQRLPTPEDSNYRSETMIRQLLDESFRSHNFADPRLNHAPARTYLHTPEEDQRARRDSRNLSPPRSPPYPSSDTQKSILPPLKIVLSNDLSSPPTTPCSNRASLQPSPREPVVATAIYKPPALYPHKKQRTDGLSNASRSLRRISSSGSSSDYPLSASEFSFTQYASDKEPSRAGFTLPPTALVPAPTSVPQTSARQQYTNDSFRGLSPSYHHPPIVTASSRDRYFDTHTSYPYQSTISGHDDRPLYYDEGVQNPLLSPTTSRHPRSVDDHARVRTLMRPLDRDDYYRAARDGSHPSSPSQPAFFLPAHGDLHHTKARKRSNLPKQSTEIMKTWFDQNLANPYPSEEQKAMFSNATGISMTQVSNWFINHRRRCPELREQRDLVRGRSCGE